MTTKVISLSSSSFLPVFSHYRFNPQMGIKVSVVYRVVPSDGWWPVLVSHWSRTPAIKETPTYNPILESTDHTTDLEMAINNSAILDGPHGVTCLCVPLLTTLHWWDL